MIPLRYIFFFLHGLVFTIYYMCRVNMSVALLSMVNSTMFKKVNVSSECKTTSNDDNKVISNNNHGSFLWNDFEQSLILSNFYWGYILLQLPAGILAVKIGGKRLVLVSTFMSGLCVIACPLAAYTGSYYLATVRFLFGLSQGVAFPTIYHILYYWLIPSESTLVAAFLFIGCPIGSIIGQSLSGVIADTIGWQYIFYIMGGLNFIWCIVYFIIVTDSPVDNRFMSKSEKQLLIDNIPQLRSDFKHEIKSAPWFQILTSRVVLCFSIIYITFNYYWYILFNCLPYYVGFVLDFQIINNGMISSIPYILYMVGNISSGYVMKFFEDKKFSLNVIRKWSLCMTMFLAAFFLFIITLLKCETMIIVFLLCISFGMLGCTCSVININMIEVSPSYTGSIVAIPNMTGNIFGILTPYIKEYFTKTGETRDNWTNIFYTSIISLLLGSFSYLILGTAEVQSWDPSYKYTKEQNIIHAEKETNID